MMWKHIDHKVPGGKLIRIDADIVNSTINDIHISGDFFLHPEESIETIEDALRSQKIRSSMLKNKLTSATKDIRMIGISAGDILMVLDKFISE